VDFIFFVEAASGHFYDLAGSEHAEMSARALDASGTCSSLEAKVKFLRQKEAYAEHPTSVQAIETHMSWVFPTDRHAYKLKKPVRYEFLDFSTIDARHRDCEEEIRLNRRLAPDVYLDLVPLTLIGEGKLSLGAAGQVIDWLVKMRRLPAHRMLDQALKHRAVSEAEIRAVARLLARFDRASAPIEMTPVEYRKRFADDIVENLRELTKPAFGLAPDRLSRLTAAQFELLAHEPGLFNARLTAGKVIEAHGDLRPEHICLETPPVIIDCLEFKREFRILDAADELAFLAMECDRLGAPHVGETVFETYTAMTGDRSEARLVSFYKSYRALLRAKIAIWHLKEPSVLDPTYWIGLANDYLRLAEGYAERLLRNQA
jgi:aminoglycoside phosphotransferase family enzyme